MRFEHVQRSLKVSFGDSQPQLSSNDHFENVSVKPLHCHSERSVSPLFVPIQDAAAKRGYSEEIESE